MKSFLRENPTIAFGLGLPLLLVVVFLLISGIPSLLVAPPQYEVLYATEYYNNQNAVQISVIDKKVQIIYQDRANNNSKPRLWLYNPKTGAVKEITFLIPTGLGSGDNRRTDPEDTAKTILIDVPDLKGLLIDSSSIAPDGYQFSVGRDGYSGIGLFYTSRYRHEALLTKEGRNIRIPKAGSRYYNNNVRFIGWVVSS